MKRSQVTITYPQQDAAQELKALLLLKKKHCLNISAFCREAIAKKLEELEIEKPMGVSE